MDNCPICFDFYTIEGDYFVLTPCGHYFHNSCIQKYFIAKIGSGLSNITIECPNCRTPIGQGNLTQIKGIYLSKPKHLGENLKAQQLCLELDKIRGKRAPKTFHHKFRLIMLGYTQVGKTSLLKRFTDDTGGQERFNSITPNFVRGVDGVLIVYEICHKMGFEKIDEYVEMAQEYAPGAKLFLVGNKCDMANSRVIPYKEGKKRAEALDCPFFETSAKDGTQVEAVFRGITALIFQDKILSQDQNQNGESNTRNFDEDNAFQISGSTVSLLSNGEIGCCSSFWTRMWNLFSTLFCCCCGPCCCTD